MKKLKYLLLALLCLTLFVPTSLPSVKAQEGPLKIALLIASRGDLSFNDSAIEGLERAAADFGDQVDINILEIGDDPSNYEPTFLDTADAGYDVIAVSATLEDFLYNYAPDYPDTQFWLFDVEFRFDEDPEAYKNVYSIVYKANEASYLGGYVAAKTSSTGVLGFLGGIDQNIISDFLVGFIQGAKEANPDIKVITSYVGSWADSAKGKELGFAMFNQKASLAFNVAGGSGVGLIEAALETGNQVLGVDSDQALIYESQGQEDFAKIIPTSVLKNIGDSLYRAVDLALKGELKLGENETLGIAEGGVGLADNHFYQEMVSQDIRDQVKALEEKILSGEIQVDSAYTMTQEEIDAIRASVAP
ncbi:TPA: BMP family ABC transporter substrate-binding protein [Streptococcus suis]